MKKLTLMICTMMRGLDDDQIRMNFIEVQTFLIDYLYKEYNGEVELHFTDNFTNYRCPAVDDNDDAYRMFCMGNGISNVMSMSDIVVLSPGWQNSRGCIAEALIAKLYNKQIMMVNRNVDNGKLYVASHDAFVTQLKLAMTLFGIYKEK